MKAWKEVRRAGVALLGIALLMTVGTGCGKKTRPIPKDARVPRAVKNLQIKKLPDSIQLTWREPRKDLRGDKLKGLAGYDVLRKIVKPDSNECVDCPGGGSVVAVLDRDNPVNFKASDHTITWTDKDIKKKGIYVYRVVPFNANGYNGEISNFVKVEIP